MKWEIDPAFINLFGECLCTVYRGRHLIMTWHGGRSVYVVQESATRREVTAARRKGEIYKWLRANYAG